MASRWTLLFNSKAPRYEELPRGEIRVRRLGELHTRDEGVGDGDFFGEGDDGSLDGEMFEAVAGAALEDEVTEVYELVFVLGEAASGHEVGEDDNLIGEVIVTVAVFPDFELDVDVASEVAEGCTDAVPVAAGIIAAGIIALGDVDAELPTANLGCIRHSWSKLRSASLAREVVEQVFDAVGCDCREGLSVGCCHFF